MARNRKSKLVLYVEFAVAKTILFVLGVLPRGAAIGLGIFVAKVGFRLLSRLRKTGLRNLELAFPEKSENERLQILKGTFENLGRVLGEVSQFHKYTRDDLARIVDFQFDEETTRLYEQVKREKRGVVITTGHLGNWEMLVFAFAALYEPMSYLARPLDNPLLEELTVGIRTRFGARPINKANSAMLAIKLLREGEILGVLADVNAHPKEGVFVPFFGIESCTTAGPAMFAIRTNSILFPIFCVFDKENDRYKIVRGAAIEPVITGDRTADVLATTAAYTSEIEKVIRIYPEQWLWIHKRWKTRPIGEPDLY